MKPSGEVRWSAATVRIPREFADDFPAWIVRPGDLVINMTAQSLEDRFLGRVCRMHDKALLNQRIGRLHPSGVQKDFLYVALRVAEFTDWVARKSEGSKVKHMHWRHIEDYPLPAPDSALQTQIVEEHRRWQRVIERNDDALAALSPLSSTLRMEIFGGRY
jgi:type I restriction enzyme S subunit